MPLNAGIATSQQVLFVVFHQMRFFFVLQELRVAGRIDTFRVGLLAEDSKSSNPFSADIVFSSGVKKQTTAICARAPVGSGLYIPWIGNRSSKP